jgi:hypothetical protein
LAGWVNAEPVTYDPYSQVLIIPYVVENGAPVSYRLQGDGSLFIASDRGGARSASDPTPSYRSVNGRRLLDLPDVSLPVWGQHYHAVLYQPYAQELYFELESADLLDTTPRVHLQVSDSACAEQDQDPCAVEIIREGEASAALRIAYRLSGSASLSDYSGLAPTTAGTLELAAGAARLSLTFTPVDDSEIEDNETLNLELLAGTGYTLGSPASASLTIADNDALPQLSVRASDAQAAEAGPDPAELVVERQGDLSQALSVGYRFEGDISAGDYLGPPPGQDQVFTFPAGLSQVSAPIYPQDDSEVESNETLIARLLPGDGYVLAEPSSATLTILDNDIPPSVRLLPGDGACAEQDSAPCVAELIRDGATAAALDVAYRLDGSASLSDYSGPAPGDHTYLLAAGVAQGRLTLTPVDDSLVDAGETLRLSLLAGDGYRLGEPASVQFTIADNDRPLPLLRLQSADSACAEQGQDPCGVEILREGDASAALDIAYRLGGSADASDHDGPAPGDYAYTLAAGAGQGVFSFLPVDDALAEGSETLTVELLPGDGYTLGEETQVTLSLADNDIAPPPSVQGGPLNDTGITFCGDYPDGNNDPCTGSEPLGQDSDYGRDVTHNDDSDGHAGFSFTKLDANGNPLAASAAAWVCVQDKVTGLIWEVKTDDGGLRDKDHTYTWYNPDDGANGGAAGTPDGGSCVGSACDTQGYAQAVNAQGLCGASDWRLPSREELRSIVNYNRFGPAIDVSYFPNTESAPYWSSSPYAYSSDGAWYVFFNLGDDGYLSKGYEHAVRLVRGRQ